MFADPGEPGDLKGALKAKDLINKPCLFRVTGQGMWDPKPAVLNDDGSVKFKAQGPRPYFECDVVVLGMDGIEEHGSDVRISWQRVLPQLEGRVGWVAARPKEQDDNSVILLAFNEQGKAKAAELLPEIDALFGAAADGPVYAEGEEPFTEDEIY